MDDFCKGGGEERLMEEVRRRLLEIEALYGKVPLVPQVLSEHPEVFLAYSEYSDVALQRTKHLDRRTAELAAVAAGSALASQHCLSVHIEAAYKAGAGREEVLEALLLGAFMAMTKCQSVSLRTFLEVEAKCPLGPEPEDE